MTATPDATASAARPPSPSGSTAAGVGSAANAAAAKPADAVNSAAAKPAEPSLGQLVHDATESISTIVRGEIELAKLELKSTVKNGGVGVGLFAAAGVLLIFSLTFGLLALAEGLIAIGLYRWLGYLVVFALLLLIIAVFVFIGIKKVKKVRAPQQTIDTGKETVAYLRSHPKTTP